jgi:hypothetical protein
MTKVWVVREKTADEIAEEQASTEGREAAPAGKEAGEHGDRDNQ